MFERWWKIRAMNVGNIMPYKIPGTIPSPPMKKRHVEAINNAGIAIHPCKYAKKAKGTNRISTK